MADEVVDLFKGAEKSDHAAPVRDKETERQRYCGHRRVELDKQARRVYCRECGVEVPAFDFLESLSNEWHRMVDARKEARRLADLSKDRLADLERREANCKSRLRTARRNLASLHPTLKLLEDLLRSQQHYVSRQQILEVLDNGPANER
jgi:hypothetical protein